MKVTTELKNFIKREFANKKELVKKEYKEKGKKDYEEELANLEKTKEFQNYKKAKEELFKYIELKIGEFGGYRNSTNGFYYSNFYSSDVEPNEYVKINSYYDYVKSNSYSDCESEVEKIDRDMEMVLIKLTYEKDFDNVKKLLSEYGIEL